MGCEGEVGDVLFFREGKGFGLDGWWACWDFEVVMLILMAMTMAHFNNVYDT